MMAGSFFSKPIYQPSLLELKLVYETRITSPIITTDSLCRGGTETLEDLFNL